MMLDKLANGLSVAETVEQTLAEAGRDPYYQARLTYYPEDIEQKTLDVLLKLEKISQD